jgi:anti-sigma factor ChrR (cupin superfamily)
VRIPGLELSVDPDGPDWRPTKVPGVAWVPLHLAGEGGPGSDSTVLIRMEPGRGYPPHRHLGIEEVLVLHGAYRDAAGVHEAGSYLRAEPGSVHAPVAVGDPDRPAGPDNPPCVLFAVAREGIELVGRG